MIATVKSVILKKCQKVKCDIITPDKNHTSNTNMIFKSHFFYPLKKQNKNKKRTNKHVHLQLKLSNAVFAGLVKHLQLKLSNAVFAGFVKMFIQ